MKHSVLRRAAAPTKITAAALGGITISTLPATVKLAGGRIDEGRFLVLTDSAQKLYWWRFWSGKPSESPDPAVEFADHHLVVPARGQFAVFSAMSRAVAVAVARKTYSSESELTSLWRMNSTGGPATLMRG